MKENDRLMQHQVFQMGKNKFGMKRPFTEMYVTLKVKKSRNRCTDITYGY